MDTRTKTIPYQFFPCTTDQKDLFSVNADIPVLDALEQANCFIAIAEEVLGEDLVNTRESAAFHLLQFGRATLQSVITALINEEVKRKGGRHE